MSTFIEHCDYNDEELINQVLQLSLNEYNKNNKLDNELEIIKDGNCLFRCISVVLYNDETYHEIIRNKMIEYIRKNKIYFKDSPNLDDSIDKWIGRMINSGNIEFNISGEYGDSFAIECLSWMLERQINVSILNNKNNVLHTESFGNWFENKPIHLILRGQHYTLYNM